MELLLVFSAEVKKNVKFDSKKADEASPAEAAKPRSRTNPAMELAKAAQETDKSSCCGDGSCKDADDTVSRIVVMYGKQNDQHAGCTFCYLECL